MSKNYPPPYISKFWTVFEGKISECSNKQEKNRILSEYANMDKFMKRIHGCLDRSLMGFLGMVDDDDETEELNSIIYE